jgi:hypothetical protein
MQEPCAVQQKDFFILWFKKKTTQIRNLRCSLCVKIRHLRKGSGWLKIISDDRLRDKNAIA